MGSDNFKTSGDLDDIILEDNILKNNLEILLFNLEAKHVVIKVIKDKLDNIFNKISNDKKKMNLVIEQTIKILEDSLDLENNIDKKNLKIIYKILQAKVILINILYL